VDHPDIVPTPSHTTHHPTLVGTEWEENTNKKLILALHKPTGAGCCWQGTLKFDQLIDLHDYSGAL